MTDKPTCEPGARLCKPSMYPGPSGVRMRHDRSCPDKPGQPISAREYVGGGKRIDWPPRGRIR